MGENLTVCSRIWHLWNRPVAGLLSRDVVSGERVESLGMTGSCAAHAPDLAVSHAASLHVVCSRHVEFHVLCESSVNDPLRWSISLAIGGSKHFAVGTLVWSTWDKTSARAPYEQVELDKAQMGKKKKKKRLHFILYPDSICISWELSMRFPWVTYR